MDRTIIISNRLPVTIRKVDNHFEFAESIGGLSTGLKGYHKKADSMWIGWPGLSNEEIGPENMDMIRQTLVKQYQCYPVFLSNSEIGEYYYGFCNKTIWPLFHYFTSMTEYESSMWKAYCLVNQKFFSAAASLLRENDIVWIHDYQLMLLPSLIKENYPDTKIGFFLHIPFPSFEIFRLLVWREEILTGLLGADLIGFHTYSYVRHFLSSARNLLGTVDHLNRIEYEDRQVWVDAFPMGIDYDRFAAKHELDSCFMESADIETLRDHRIILSVDRLDYTKGIPERIKAFQLFLTKYPEYRERMRWYLIVAPSRAEIDTYDALLSQIKEAVSETNGKFGTVNWMPIWFFYRSYPQEALINFYRYADVLLVTPLRDGMNLVVKEYIATRTDYEGMVVISETAGTASQLVEAVPVNPNDFNAIAEGIHTALVMPREEKIARNKIMHQRIRRYSVKFWADEFLHTLVRKAEELAVESPKINLEKHVSLLQKAYAATKSRILLLDYDGTLVGFRALPEQAKPDEELRILLKQLSGNPANTVVIVSGRDRHTLEQWLGDIPRLYLIASHGLWLRLPHQLRWIMTTEQTDGWKDQIRPILERYADHMPGSLIEEKDFSLAWHYRQCEPDMAELKLRELKETLLSMTRSSSLGLQEGNKVLEIKDSRINKGITASLLIKSREYDFLLGAGDDYTDEDLFSVMPRDAFSIKVGAEKTCANYRVRSWKSMRAVLHQLNAAGADSRSAEERR